MSVSTPTLTTPSEICAAAGPAAQTASARARAAVRVAVRATVETTVRAAVDATVDAAVEARFRLVRAIGPPFLRVCRCDGCDGLRRQGIDGASPRSPAARIEGSYRRS